MISALYTCRLSDNMRLCSYVTVNISGLAPNPFGGYCTLALCTPNHMGICADAGDWFIGTLSAGHGDRNTLVYAMEVSEVLGFDAYYGDPRFVMKKPVVAGSWQQRCGDNMFYVRDGSWWQHHSVYHRGQDTIDQDLRHSCVYIAANTWYFFPNCDVIIPVGYRDLVWGRKGCKCSYDPSMVADFLGWLCSEFDSGTLPVAWRNGNVVPSKLSVFEEAAQCMLRLAGYDVEGDDAIKFGGSASLKKYVVVVPIVTGLDASFMFSAGSVGGSAGRKVYRSLDVMLHDADEFLLAKGINVPEGTVPEMDWRG